MLSQITKQISENISQSLAKHAPSQNLAKSCFKNLKPHQHIFLGLNKNIILSYIIFNSTIHKTQRTCNAKTLPKRERERVVRD